MGEKVKFGIDDLIHNGMSYDLSPKGMSIIAEEVLPAKSNILIRINTEIGFITVEGEVIWVSSIPDLPSRMGVKFNKRSERRLIRIYKAKKPRSK